MARKPKHAAARLVERYLGECNINELQNKIKNRDFVRVQRQTVTKSLCVAFVNDRDVWFVLDRKTYNPVTVLTEEQARTHLTEAEIAAASKEARKRVLQLRETEQKIQVLENRVRKARICIKDHQAALRKPSITEERKGAAIHEIMKAEQRLIAAECELPKLRKKRRKLK